jgi:hypothetical protein
MMAFYYSRENYRNIVRGSTLTGSGVISSVNTGLTGQNDDEIDRGISGPITGLTPPSILTFYTIPTQVSWGDPLSIFWTTTNAVSVSLNNGIGDASSFGVSSGRYDVTRLEQPTVYELTATNSSGSVKKYAVVGMRTLAPVFNHFYADPDSVFSGSGFTLYWSILENPTNVSISGIGDVTSFGASDGQYRVTSITQATIFTATATNAFGSTTKTASVTIRQQEATQPPTIWSFFADPPNTGGTGRTTLRWAISNSPTSITITPDVGSVSPTSNSVEVSGILQNKSYTLTASNAGGIVNASTTVIFGSADTGNAGVTVATDFPGTNSLVSVEDMKNIIRNNMSIWFNMDGNSTTLNPGARAVGFYADDPSFSWFRFVNGNYKGASGQQIADAAGNTIDPYDTLKNTSLKEWYKWGARRFSIHQPFGKVPLTANTTQRQEALSYQPDAYINARDGLNIGGITCNEPMPWLIPDFVKTFKALVTGTQGTLTNQEWNILTGVTGWFNPADPIKLLFYTGTINNENYIRWKTYGYTGAKQRLIEGYQPYLDVGADIGLDALVVCPGPTVGINYLQAQHLYSQTNPNAYAPFVGDYGDGTTLGPTLDAVWWDVYSNWILPNFGQDSVFAEAAPTAFKIGNTWYDSPYLGLPFISDDEFFNNAYGNEPNSTLITRMHKLSEMGPIEVFFPMFQGIRRMSIVGVSGPSGFTFGRYWYLNDYAAPAYYYDNNGNTFPEMDGNARVYRVVESTGYGTIQWDYALAADKLLNKSTGKYDDPKLDETKHRAYLNWSSLFNSPIENQGEGGAYTNIGGVEDFASRFPTIDDYAHYLAFLKSGGTPIPRGFSTGYRHPTTRVDPNKIIDHTKLLSFGLKNNGIENAVWIYLDELDAYTRGKLNGKSGGQFYTPSITADVEQTRIKNYLDYRLERAKETLGYYPKYFVFSLTKNDGSTQPSQFQMERYLYTPATYPISTDYTQYDSGGGQPSYDDSLPTVLDLDQTANPEIKDILLSTGYLINSTNYLLTVDIINKLLTTARQWKNERGYSDIKFGIEGVPEVTLEPRTSYTITGGGTGLTLERFNEWGLTQWSKPLINGGSETLGTQATAVSKTRVLLEFSKRVEPLLPNLDVLYPTVYDYYTNTDSQDNRYKSYQDVKLDLSQTLKAAPFSFSGDIVPLVSYSHVGDIEGGTVGNLDPIALSGGTTYDDAQVYSDIIDWVRDDHGNGVQGYAFWNDTSYAASAMGISSYAGITADRDRVLKWIKSFDGAGATIDWTNSVDVEEKLKRFYDVHSELLKRYAYRFGGESLEQPNPSASRLKIIMQGLYHPSNGNGIVQNVFDTGVSYDTLDVVPGKILYASSVMGIAGICLGTGRYTFVSPWGNPSKGLTEPFQNDIPGNTLTAAYVNTLALTQGRTADYESAATELLRLRWLNLDQTFDGDICKWRADDCPPLGSERTSYTGYILPDPEFIAYPRIGVFQTAGETFHIETCKFVNRIVYNACKQVWPQAKVGFWGECMADYEPFNTYDIRWDDFIQNPAVNGAGFVDDNGTSLTITGLTGYVNYVAKKLKYIYEGCCDFVCPSFYSPYEGISSDGPDDADIHYSQIASLWNSATGHKIVNSRTRTMTDVTLKLIKRMNELLVSEGKERKEVYPAVWNLGIVSNQWGLLPPDSPVNGCGITFGLTADRADSYYSLRKFMEQNLGVSGSTYTFWNLGHFSPSQTCDSINLTRRRHPEGVKLDRDQYYDRYIKPGIESGVVDGFYQWNKITSYDYAFAARSKAELTALGLLNLGDTLDSRSQIAVDTIYQRRLLLSEVLGLCMAGLTYGAYFNNPNEFPGATVAGFSFGSWGEYNTIGHPASKFARHKMADYILSHYCKYWADRAISDGILETPTQQQNQIDLYLWGGFAANPASLQSLGNIDGAWMSTGNPTNDLEWYNILKNQGFKFITSIVDGDSSPSPGFFAGHPTVITGGVADWQGIANWLIHWHGLTQNHTENFYVSLNFELDYKDRILRGLDPDTGFQDNYLIGDRGLCGANNQAATQELSDVFDNLKSFFGSNVKFSFWGLPYIQPAYHVGIGDFDHRDPGGISGNIQTWGVAWHNDAYGAGVDINNRISTAAIQFQELASHADFMNTIQYEIIPTPTAITGSNVRPYSLVVDRGNGSPTWDCGKAVCVTAGVIDKYKTYLAYTDQALAGISSANRINQLNGLTQEIMPTYSLTYYGIPYYYGIDETVPDNEGFWYQFIPLEDTLSFFNKMRSDYPNINKVALFDSEYGRKAAFIPDGRLNGGTTAQDNTNIQAVYGGAADVDLWRRYRVSLRDTYIRNFFGGNATGINFDTNSANDPSRGISTTNLRKYIADIFNTRLIAMKNLINNTT